MKVLLTDWFFPSVYCKWRLVEIHSFIEKYNSDICVFTANDKTFNIEHTFDYIKLCDEFHLKNYQILIFNPNYNFINKYNDNFDGTVFNNKFPGINYIFRHKSNSAEDFNIYNYDKYYHIFLSAFKSFNHIFANVPLPKQFLHLYPGGGFCEDTNNEYKHFLRRKVIQTNIIYTQKFIEPYVKDKKRCKKVYIYGCPLLYKNEIIRVKQQLVTPNQLTVAFASMGNPIAKGLIDYLQIVYLAKQSNLPFHFITIGNCDIDLYLHFIKDKYPNVDINILNNVHKSIKHYPPMEQSVLDDFYHNSVDVYLNLEENNHMYKNGWPLGAEPTIQGCVLLTNDNYEQNEANNFIIDNFFIVDNNYSKTVNKLVQLLSTDVFLSKSKQIQKIICEIVKYDNIMPEIFQFLEKH